MIGFALGCVIAIAAVALGLKGFSAGGIPLTKTTFIKGTTGKIVGAICIALGVLMLLVLVLGIVLYSARTGRQPD